MYHAHFGLERGLFAEGIAADGDVFRTPKHDRLIAHFKLALASPSSSIVLHGPAGAGKTTLTATALRATTTRLAVAWVNGMATNAAELLELILVELGINTLRTTRIERLQLWRQFQGEMRATDSRLFIVVERTEDLSPEVLHALDQLTAPDAVGNPGANLVLLGHAGIDEHLAAPVLDSLRQRIRLRAELEPFTEAEIQDYLRHQVACAGGHYDRIFAPGTVAALHRYSQGIARLANTLCESALDLAAIQQQKQLTAELVAKTATSLLGLAEPVPAARPAATAARVESAPSVETRTASRPLAAGMPAAERPPEPRATAAPMPPAVAQTVSARPAPPPSSPAPARMAAKEPKAVDVEFDGSATDIADVALADFPILTDAVEAPLPAPPAKQSAPAPAKAPAAAAPSAKPASRLEAFYAASRPTQKPLVSPAATAPTASTAPPPAAAATPRAAPVQPAAPPARAAAPRDSEDVLRQTQTMRAISAAKSIDDLSEVDAETLFGDAELDLVSAALAAEWPDEDDSTPAPVSPPAPPAAAKATPVAAKAPPAAAKAAPPDEDPFDLFGLGDDAPLELIDDSSHPSKSAAR